MPRARIAGACDALFKKRLYHLANSKGWMNQACLLILVLVNFTRLQRKRGCFKEKNNKNREVFTVIPKKGNSNFIIWYQIVWFQRMIPSETCLE
jgi:hypothetical protein